MLRPGHGERKPSLSRDRPAQVLNTQDCDEQSMGAEALWGRVGGIIVGLNLATDILFPGVLVFLEI